jgi:catechol 2,3-dioxygenase-like lactoylglutathione lyase family enzyme
MDMKLELVPIPVSDIDRSKAFYVDGLGFNEDVDVRPAEDVRVVQLTPPARRSRGGGSPSTSWTTRRRASSTRRSAILTATRGHCRR